MNPCPYIVSPNTRISQVFNLFRTMGLRHLPVVNAVGEVSINIQIQTRSYSTATYWFFIQLLKPSTRECFHYWQKKKTQTWGSCTANDLSTIHFLIKTDRQDPFHVIIKCFGVFCIISTILYIFLGNAMLQLRSIHLEKKNPFLSCQPAFVVN